MKISVKITILLTAASLFFAPTALTVSAQPSGPGNGIEKAHVRMFVEPIIIGHGFALNGDQYHILDVNAIKMNEVSSGFIRSLFSQKKSPEDIAKEINNAQMETITRAHLRFAGQMYALNITSYDNKSLTGDVMTIPPYTTNLSTFTPTIVGHISLSLSKYEGDMLSTGTLAMNNTDYKVLLTSPIIVRGW